MRKFDFSGLVYSLKDIKGKAAEGDVSSDLVEAQKKLTDLEASVKKVKDENKSLNNASVLVKSATAKVQDLTKLIKVFLDNIQKNEAAFSARRSAILKEIDRLKALQGLRITEEHLRKIVEGQELELKVALDNLRELIVRNERSFMDILELYNPQKHSISNFTTAREKGVPCIKSITSIYDFFVNFRSLGSKISTSIGFAKSALDELVLSKLPLGMDVLAEQEALKNIETFSSGIGSLISEITSDDILSQVNVLRTLITKKYDPQSDAATDAALLAQFNAIGGVIRNAFNQIGHLKREIEVEEVKLVQEAKAEEVQQPPKLSVGTAFRGRPLPMAGQPPSGSA